MTDSKVLSKRRLYLVVAVIAMLFSGVIYAWSILKIPFKNEFAWGDASLALNFTLTMCFFCLGAFFGSLICKRTGPKLALIIAGILAGIGFGVTGLLNKDSLYLLFITYAVLGGSGIGISYNVIVSTVNAWFPDKKGFCSGCLMMGFGFSTLLLGNLSSYLFEIESFGWRKVYLVLGAALAVILVLCGFILRRPTSDTVLPVAKVGKTAKKEDFESRDFTTLEMIRRFTFIKAFICLIFITAVGNSVISFARDLVLSVGAAPTLATTLVGVLAVFNGVGRILTGALYDTLGRRLTMLASNVVTIIAAGITLVAVWVTSLPLCIVGLCLTGISYGSCPTISSAFTLSFYGSKHFSTNYSITNFNLIVASFIATFCNNLLISTGSYTAPFVMLLTIAVIALGLNFSIRKP